MNYMNKINNLNISTQMTVAVIYCIKGDKNKHLVVCHEKAMFTTFGGAAYLARIELRFLML